MSGSKVEPLTRKLGARTPKMSFDILAQSISRVASNTKKNNNNNNNNNNNIGGNEQ